MKKKCLKSVLIATMATVLLSGCSSSRTGAYSDAGMAETYDYNGVKSATVMTTDKYMDYSNVSISGDLADYSYQFNAQGEVKEKETVLAVYDKIQAFVNEKEGYISELKNNYTGYAIEKGDSYFSNSEINYIASGSLAFSVEIKNEYAEEVIQLLDDFVNANHMIVTRYNQTATNYKDVRIVDYYDKNVYDNYMEMTTEELQRRLNYSTINIRLAYTIPRGSAEAFGLKCRNLFSEVKEIVLAVLLVIVIVLVCLWALVCLGVIPIYKCIRKSVMKHKAKRPELYPAKEIKLVTEEKKEENK